jgi:hypothetical protein
MLQATFCPLAVSSIPLTKSGAVSNRRWISAEKVSLSAFCIVARCSGGRSKALRTRAVSEAVLKALARSDFAWPSIARKRRVNTSTKAFFQTGRGQVGQRLSRDGKHFPLGPANDGLI